MSKKLVRYILNSPITFRYTETLREEQHSKFGEIIYKKGLSTSSIVILKKCNIKCHSA